MKSIDPVDILLAEDNDAEAELTLRALNRRMINSIVRVRDGVELLAFVFREHPFRGNEISLPNLILLDLNMPKVNGIEVLQTLRSDDLTKDIPVILLTGSSESQHFIDAHSMGITGVLLKPFSFAEFDRVVANLHMGWALVTYPAA